jgi:heat-inducible transcriptional repressor
MGTCADAVEVADMDERSWEVLNATVVGYIRNASPIGSRAVNRQFGLNYSPATIRNVMADLEETGYLMHPHTSAGRVPTPKGFRYFVDNTRFPGLESESADQLSHLLDAVLADTASPDLLSVLSSVINLVSRMTRSTGILLGTGTNLEECLLSLDLVQISPRHVLMVVITESGSLLKKTLLIPEDVDIQEVISMGQELSRRARHKTLLQVRSEIISELEALGRSLLDVFNQLTSLSPEPDVRVFCTSYFAEVPEFKNANTLREIMEVFEEQSALYRIFEELLTEDQMALRIGNEIPVRALEPCTLISIPLRSGNVWLGSIGLVGPIRMQYDQVIPIMMYLSDRLNLWIDEVMPPTSHINS